MTRVLIVDDHPVFRDGLAGLLATVPWVEVTGTAGTAEEALAAIKDTAPDVVLMDINLPGTSGVEATRRVAQLAPATAVLVITMVDDDDTVFAALAAGARGYVLKGAPGDDHRGAAHHRRGRRRVRCRGRQPAPGPHARAVIRPDEPIPARRPDHTGTRGPRPAGRGRQQPADRPIPRHLPENRAKPRLPYPRQAPGRRPDPGRPPRQGHPAATTALRTPQTPPAPSGVARTTAARQQAEDSRPALKSWVPLGRRDGVKMARGAGLRLAGVAGALWPAPAGLCGFPASRGGCGRQDAVVRPSADVVAAWRA
jgi:CheY-like chemotaxis protein